MALVFFMVLAVIVLAFWLRPWPFFQAYDEVDSSDERGLGTNIVFRKWVEHQARARGLSVRGVARQVPIQCPKCGKASNYFVYPDELCERCWTATLKSTPTPAKDNQL